MKIVKMSDHSWNGKMWSVMDMLEDSIQELRDRPDSYNKAIILFLDDRNSGYSTSFAQAGMGRSEIISLLETMKFRFLNGLETDPA